MMTWIKAQLRRILGADAEQAAKFAATIAENIRLRRAHEELREVSEARLELLKGSQQIVRDGLAAVKRAKSYMEDVPEPTQDAPWTADDAKQLAHFLEEAPAGRRLMAYLNSRCADYNQAARVRSDQSTAAALWKRCQGFHDCRAEILKLSAAGPSPANHESEAMALPADLEKFRA